VVSPRGELDEYSLRHSAGRKRLILWLYRNLIAHRCTFHSTSPQETEYIKRQFGREVRIVDIPNYIELPDVVTRNLQNYLLFVGRLKPKKAIENLIGAAARSRGFLESDFVLKIAGRGGSEYLDRLRQLASDLGIAERVQFIGQIEGAAKEKLYADAYWTFMPSHTENFGMVVLESLAQNTPVLAAKGTPWQILEDEKVGFWSDNSPASLAARIDEIISMPADQYEGYRQRGREFVEEHFDIRKNINRWNNFYASLADK
jgi:glycosyltransferase involved in cell wall biosynthesis